MNSISVYHNSFKSQLFQMHQNECDHVKVLILKLPNVDLMELKAYLPSAYKSESQRSSFSSCLFLPSVILFLDFQSFLFTMSSGKLYLQLNQFPTNKQQNNPMVLLKFYKKESVFHGTFNLSQSISIFTL